MPSKFDTLNESYYIPLPRIVCVLSKLIYSMSIELHAISSHYLSITNAQKVKFMATMCDGSSGGHRILSGMSQEFSQMRKNVSQWRLEKKRMANRTLSLISNRRRLSWKSFLFFKILPQISVLSLQSIIFQRTVKSLDSEVRLFSTPQLHYWRNEAVCIHLQRNLTFLCLSFHVYKIAITTVPATQYCQRIK